MTDPDWKTLLSTPTILDLNPEVAAVVLNHQWPVSKVSIEMGAFWEFDYAFDSTTTIGDRITRCYELAGQAMMPLNIDEIPDELPVPALLIHGEWSSPVTRDKPIGHAWVMLSDETVWEPITRTLCEPDAFYEYTQGKQTKMYLPHEACRSMIRHGHYGVWP